MRPSAHYQSCSRATMSAFILAIAGSLAACDQVSVPTAVPVLASASRTAVADRADRALKVMTYNIYQGTELQNSIAATTPMQFLLGAGMDFEMMRQTDFAKRVFVIASEVAEHHPDLIGLQEVAQWRTAPYPGSAPAVTVEQDFLAMLLRALEARGLHYEVVSSVSNFDVQAPARLSTGVVELVRLTDSNVILARRDTGEAHLAVFNAQSSNFATNLHIATVGGDVTVLEGWASIDVKRRGRVVRFITTHLDAFAPPIRAAQANEVLNGPANTDLPVVLVGDLNSTTTATSYLAFAGSGFMDIWATLFPGDPGFTCCQVLPTIDNASSALSKRIDYVLARGLFPAGIDRLGVDASSRTASGLWPSDHAGLVATLVLEQRD